VTRPLALVCLGSLLSTMALAGPLEEKLANLANQPDVVLMPPVGEPSPPPGTFVIRYQAPEGEEPDPRREGTYELAPSSCSETLVFKKVAAAETRSELWMVETGIGLSIGLQAIQIGGGYGRKAMAGLDYTVTEKLILDTGFAELEECCLRTPEACTDRYISEFWLGTGRISRLASSGANLKASIKKLEKVGSLDFGTQKGWSQASEWNDPMYFAYRAVTFQKPSCQSHMNNLPEVEGQVLFTGVSARSESEQKARRDARDDARMQVAEYLGTHYELVGDEALAQAVAIMSGVKDSLVCLDDVAETPDGPSYLARVRMYVATEELDAGRLQTESLTK